VNEQNGDSPIESPFMCISSVEFILLHCWGVQDYFFHSRIVFDVKQSWERVPLPYLDGEYSKISWFFFTFGVFCSRQQRFFKSFCLFWCMERCFLLLFVSFGVGNDVFGFFLFVGEMETLFRIAFGLWGEEKPCFLVPVGWVGRRDTVSWYVLILLSPKITFWSTRIRAIQRFWNNFATFVNVLSILFF